MQRLVPLVFVLVFVSCSVSHQLKKSATETVLRTEALQAAHVGISVYEPATGRTWYDYQGDKYFVPASNTKIPTCYAAMKYLGDSLVGIRYGIPEESWFKDKAIVIDATGDPSFLHGDFRLQSVFNFFQTQLMANKKTPGFFLKNNTVERWGSGWSWNDYQAAYMAERSIFPVYGNLVRIELNDLSHRTYVDTFLMPDKRLPGKVFKAYPQFFDSLVNRREKFHFGGIASPSPKIEIKRDIASNSFSIENSDKSFTTTFIPFVNENGWTTINILSDTFKKQFALVGKTGRQNEYYWESGDGDIAQFHIKQWHTLHSQPTDSLLRPMMHRSDNFFAEQTLLMVSNETLGFMSDEKMIDTLLKTDLKDLPQRPRWVDGSGLSRYNLFTPQDFVFILAKMQNEFGMARIKNIFATGGEGTLSSYYKKDSTFIYAKTGTLSGVVALSGFLETKKGKGLIFSVLVNNHQGSAMAVRQAVEAFVEGIRKRY